jgi:hypothetical protein
LKGFRRDWNWNLFFGAFKAIGKEMVLIIDCRSLGPCHSR